MNKEFADKAAASFVARQSREAAELRRIRANQKRQETWKAKRMGPEEQWRCEERRERVARDAEAVRVAAAAAQRLVADRIAQARREEDARRRATGAIVVAPAKRLEVVESDDGRPRTREDCARSERPCPWVGCRHHLAIDVTSVGSIVRDGASHLPLNATAFVVEAFAESASDALCDMQDTCSLDIADRGDATLHDVGELLGVTRERVRQIESMALVKLRGRRGEVGEE